MMGCWIVAGYMAYSGIDYTYNTIFYTEWMNLTSKGGEEIWTFGALFSHWSDGDIHCCLFWHMGIRFVKHLFWKVVSGTIGFVEWFSEKTICGWYEKHWLCFSVE